MHTPSKKLRLWIQSAALLVLVPVALSLWTAPRRREIALQHAALPALEDEYRQQPENARVAYYLGLRLREAGRIEEARFAFKSAASQTVDAEDIWLAWASTQADNQQTFDILTLFLTKHPQSARAHLMLAQTYQQNHAYKRAYEEAATASKLDPRNADAWRVYGINALVWSYTEEGVAALRRAVALAPNDWQNQLSLGDALLETGKRADALVCFQEATRLAPAQAVAQLSLGKCLLEQPTTPAEIELARQSLLRSATLAPEIPFVYLLLGQVYEEQRDWSKARVSLETARRLSPNDDKVSFELARVYNRSGDKASADLELARHERLRLYKSEIRKLQEQIIQKPNDSPLRLQLARLYAAHDDFTAAVKQYRQIIDRSPGATEARQELAKIVGRIRPAAAAPAPPQSKP